MFQEDVAFLELDTNEYLEDLISNNITRFKNLKFDWLKIEGSYESDYWYIQDLNLIENRKIRFFLLVKAENKLLKKKFIESLKSWCISLLEHNYSITTIAGKISDVISAIELSSYFNTKNLHCFKNEYFNKKYEECTLYTKAISLINFNNYSNLEINPEYLKIIYEFYFNNLNPERKTRTLPASKDVIKFSLVIEDFFENNIDNSNYLRFFPIYLWWNLTNIIPLRIKEFCLIKSGAIEKTKDGYLLHTPRSKNRFNRKLKYIPILIPEKLAESILDYEEKVKEFKKSTTLINYFATSYDHNLKKNKKIKLQNNDYFLPNQFRNCLNNFYEEIVQGLYGYEFIEDDSSNHAISESKFMKTKIKPTDTRHFAFLNLMVQGYHPKEIAVLGGHKDIYTQYHYHNHFEFWVDTDLMDLFISEQSNLSNLSSNFHFNILFQNVALTGNSLKDETVIPLRIGYCTDKDQNCMVDEHYLCEHWRVTKEDFKNYYDEIQKIVNQQKSYFKMLINKLLDLHKSEIFTEKDILFSEMDSKYSYRLKENANEVKQALFQLIYLKSRINSYEE